MSSVSHDWGQVDRVLRFMVPQGFDSAECAASVGISRVLVRRRAKEIGLPFGQFFGPGSKCQAGHRLQEVGFSMDGKKRRCSACKEIMRQRANDARRERKRLARRREAYAKRQIGRPKNTSNRAICESEAAANAILELVDAKGRASTPWDREAIQQQINELRTKVTA